MLENESKEKCRGELGQILLDEIRQSEVADNVYSDVLSARVIRQIDVLADGGLRVEFLDGVNFEFRASIQ